jgi:hypothetical protein
MQTQLTPWSIQGNSKLLSGFQFIGHGNTRQLLRITLYFRLRKKNRKNTDKEVPRLLENFIIVFKITC